MKLISTNPSKNYEVLGEVKISSENEIKEAGGYKKSGMGKTHGEFGFNEVTQLKVVSGTK